VPSPPVPIFAYYKRGGPIAYVDFDRELLPGALNPSPWTWWTFGYRRLPGVAVASGNRVTFGSFTTQLWPHAVSVDYLAVPPDVKALDGTPADPFLGFPVTQEF
jgi:hypothetical protein